MANPRGFTKCLRTMTVLNFGSSKLATSMVSFVESVQYNRRDIQSIAIPSGEIMSAKEIVVTVTIYTPNQVVLPSLMKICRSVPSYLTLTICLFDISLQYTRPCEQSLSKPIAI